MPVEEGSERFPAWNSCPRGPRHNGIQAQGIDAEESCQRFAERPPRFLDHSRSRKSCSVIPGWATARANFRYQWGVGHRIGRLATRQPTGIPPCAQQAPYMAWQRFWKFGPAQLKEEKYQYQDKSKTSCLIISPEILDGHGQIRIYQ